MSAPIVQSLEPITLVGGGFLGPTDLDLALNRAPLLVAADGGAGAAMKAGHVPEAVIGDFDSLSPDMRARIPKERLFPIREQNSTDFDKALRGISAPLVLAVGFLGARVDHQLAALNTLVRRADCPCILIGANEVICHVPGILDVALSPGDIVSLFPMARVKGCSLGLEWPIDGLDLAPGECISTSNRALGPVRLETDGAGLLMIAPRAALDVVMRAIELAFAAQSFGTEPA